LTIEKYCKFVAFVEAIIAAHINPNSPPNIRDVSNWKKELHELRKFQAKSATINKGKNTSVGILAFT
jgi:hypothetical protein